MSDEYTVAYEILTELFVSNAVVMVLGLFLVGLLSKFLRRGLNV